VVNCGQAQSYWVVKFIGLLGGTRSYSASKKALAANHTKSTTYSDKRKFSNLLVAGHMHCFFKKFHMHCVSTSFYYSSNTQLLKLQGLYGGQELRFTRNYKFEQRTFAANRVFVDSKLSDRGASLGVHIHTSSFNYHEHPLVYIHRHCRSRYER